MRITDILSRIKESELFVLTHNNSPVGLRVKCFSVKDGAFHYYDFRLECLDCDTVLRDFIQSHQSQFTKVALIYSDGQLMSKDEIDSKIRIQEFEDSESITKVISQVKYVYDSKEVGA